MRLPPRCAARNDKKRGGSFPCDRPEGSVRAGMPHRCGNYRLRSASLSGEIFHEKFCRSRAKKE